MSEAAGQRSPDGPAKDDRAATAPAAAPAAAPGPTLGQRLIAGLLAAGVRLLNALPEGFVYRLAWALGRLMGRVMHERRDLVRANLRRVVTYLDAQGMAGERARRAVRDPAVLEGMVRDVFCHWATTYVETALAPRYDEATIRSRVTLPEPERVAVGLGPLPPGAPGRIYLSIHFGAVELGALYAATVGHLPVAGPMETVANPAMQAYFERTRRALGIDVMPLKGAGPVMKRRLLDGLAVGVVADRAIAGGGARVELFGAPTRIPSGPAILAVETSATLSFVSLQRDGRGRWIGRLEEAAPAAGGLTHRQRIESLIGDHVRWIERTVAAAPEQWWSLLFPIWTEGT